MVGAHRRRPSGQGGLPAAPRGPQLRSRQGDHHMTEALIGLGLMMVLALPARARSPSPWASSASSAYAYMRDWNWSRPPWRWSQTKVYETGRNYTLSVVPLFILMGNFVTRAGMSQELFRAAYAFIGHLRGGLAMATVCACAGFGAICGSSIATAATMAKVAYPSMKQLRLLRPPVGRRDRRRRHARHPDPAVDHHGDLRHHDRDQHRQAVRRRHPAGHPRHRPAVPGRAVDRAWRDPASGPRGERSSWARAARARSRTCGRSPLLFIVVMGGIYGGVFTATEGAGMGAFGALVLRAGAARADLAHAATTRWSRARAPPRCCSLILIGALMFAEFVNYHDDAGRPEGLRHRAQPVARSWWWRRSARST